jgi:hypothetical protein
LLGQRSREHATIASVEVLAAELSFDDDGTEEELSSLGLSFGLEKRIYGVQNETFVQRQETRQDVAEHGENKEEVALPM